ncbi:hypothetical protein HK096_005747 [Nowakowskiella sp. JEL0078]|nr:hypothetical protein HK096_005747 [Nowakowskiella sp. JEL0078]
MGPSFAGEWRIAGYDLDFRRQMGLAIKYHSFHKYALRGCSKIDAILPNLMETPIPTNIFNVTDTLVPLANQQGAVVVWAEGNTVSCGGRDGLSNTYIASVWIVDALLELNLAGVGEFFLSSTPKSNYAMYSSIKGTGVKVLPPYYGLYMFYLIIGGSSTRVSRLAHPGSAQLKLWLVENKSNPQTIYSIVAIHKDPTLGDITVTARLPNGETRAKIVRINAASPDAKSGISIAGRTFEASNDGKLTGVCSPDVVVAADGVFSFTVPWLTVAYLVPESNIFTVAQRASKMIKQLKESLALKIYQYELTIGLYMLEPWEKTLFNMFLLLMLSLAMYTTYAYLPDSATYLLAKSKYYLSSVDGS